MAIKYFIAVITIFIFSLSAKASQWQEHIIPIDQSFDHRAYKLEYQLTKNGHDFSPKTLSERFDVQNGHLRWYCDIQNKQLICQPYRVIHLFELCRYAKEAKEAIQEAGGQLMSSQACHYMYDMLLWRHWEAERLDAYLKVSKSQ